MKSKRELQEYERARRRIIEEFGSEVKLCDSQCQDCDHHQNLGEEIKVPRGSEEEEEKEERNKSSLSENYKDCVSLPEESQPIKVDPDFKIPFVQTSSKLDSTFKAPRNPFEKSIWPHKLSNLSQRRDQVKQAKADCEAQSVKSRQSN